MSPLQPPTRTYLPKTRSHASVSIQSCPQENSSPSAPQKPTVMAGKDAWLRILSMSAYFFLNLLVTVTSRQVQFQTQSAWLLTASHAAATCAITSAVARFQRSRTGMGLWDDLQQHLYILYPFSLLYAMNIFVSNWTLGLVSLTMHQTIRATAPAITILVAITILGRSWGHYSPEVYSAIALTVSGVIWATQAVHRTPDTRIQLVPELTTWFGIAMTFLGAVLAVAKTILSNRLQRPHSASSANTNQPGISSLAMVRFLSLCTIGPSILLGIWTGETKNLLSSAMPLTSWIQSPGLWLWTFNALAASLLNIASFEANKRWGPVSMGVASNLKQAVILLFACLSRTWNRGGTAFDGTQEAGNEVFVGCLITLIGSIWYVVAKAKMDKRQQDQSIKRYPV